MDVRSTSCESGRGRAPRRMLNSKSTFVWTMTNPAPLQTDSEPLESTDDLHEVVSSVYHDLNNPLSIISGNAQFLLELSREEDLDDQFVSSARDIQEATERMADSLQRLTHLREHLKGQD